MYNNYCQQLIDKYGPVPDHYEQFYDELVKLNDDKITKIKMIKSPGISRAKEGLWIHHIDEYKYSWLSNQHEPYKSREHLLAQHKDKLCYCNILEHIKLHNLISRMYLNGECEQNGITAVWGYLIPRCDSYITGYKGLRPVKSIGETWEMCKQYCEGLDCSEYYRVRAESVELLEQINPEYRQKVYYCFIGEDNNKFFKQTEKCVSGDYVVLVDGVWVCLFVYMLDHWVLIDWMCRDMTEPLVYNNTVDMVTQYNKEVYKHEF